MVTHRQIIERAGGTDRERSLRLGIKEYQARDWRNRGRIPPEYWMAVVSAEMATLEELAVAASAVLADPRAA